MHEATRARCCHGRHTPSPASPRPRRCGPSLLSTPSKCGSSPAPYYGRTRAVRSRGHTHGEQRRSVREVARSIAILGRTLKDCARCFCIRRGTARTAAVSFKTSLCHCSHDHTRRPHATLSARCSGCAEAVNATQPSGRHGRYYALPGYARRGMMVRRQHIIISQQHAAHESMLRTFAHAALRRDDQLPCDP